MTSPQDRRRRIVVRAFVAGILLLPFLAEGAARLRAYLRYGAVADIYDLYREDPATGLLCPIPGLSVDIGGRARIDLSSQGFRGPDVPDPKPSGTVRLAFLGGSTTFCAQASSNATTWPARLVDRLAVARPDVRFDALNAGVTGYSIEDSTLAIDVRIDRYDPDVVVIQHVAKDLAADARSLAAEAGLLDERETGWLEERSLLWRLLKKNLWYRRSLARGASPDGKLDYDPTAVSGRFRERLTALVRRARAEADVVALCTFPILLRPGQPAAEQVAHAAQAFTFTPFLTPAALIAGYAEYNRVVREVAAAEGAVLVDDAERIPDDRAHFHDTVHLTEAGYEIQAARVADALLAAPSFVALLDRTAEARR